MKTQSVVLLAAAISLSFACASHPPPTDHMASAIAAVRGAQVAVAQAGQVPEAALHLKLAEEQVAQAREMIERGDNERANYMTLRAYNDAELALALARQHEAREAAEAAKRGGSSAPAEPAQLTPVRDGAATQSTDTNGQTPNDQSSSN
jgi:hypothetical protein